MGDIAPNVAGRMPKVPGRFEKGLSDLGSKFVQCRCERVAGGGCRVLVDQFPGHDTAVPFAQSAIRDTPEEAHEDLVRLLFGKDVFLAALNRGGRRVKAVMADLYREVHKAELEDACKRAEESLEAQLMARDQRAPTASKLFAVSLHASRAAHDIQLASPHPAPPPVTRPDSSTVGPLPVRTTSSTGVQDTTTRLDEPAALEIGRFWCSVCEREVNLEDKCGINFHTGALLCKGCCAKQRQGAGGSTPMTEKTQPHGGAAVVQSLRGLLRGQKAAATEMAAEVDDAIGDLKLQHSSEVGKLCQEVEEGMRALALRLYVKEQGQQQESMAMAKEVLDRVAVTCLRVGSHDEEIVAPYVQLDRLVRANPPRSAGEAAWQQQQQQPGAAGNGPSAEKVTIQSLIFAVWLQSDDGPVIVTFLQLDLVTPHERLPGLCGAGSHACLKYLESTGVRPRVGGKTVDKVLRSSITISTLLSLVKPLRKRGAKTVGINASPAEFDGVKSFFTYKRQPSAAGRVYGAEELYRYYATGPNRWGSTVDFGVGVIGWEQLQRCKSLQLAMLYDSSPYVHASGTFSEKEVLTLIEQLKREQEAKAVTPCCNKSVPAVQLQGRGQVQRPKRTLKRPSRYEGGDDGSSVSLQSKKAAVSSAKGPGSRGPTFASAPEACGMGLAGAATAAAGVLARAVGSQASMAPSLLRDSGSISNLLTELEGLAAKLHAGQQDLLVAVRQSVQGPSVPFKSLETSLAESRQQYAVLTSQWEHLLDLLVQRRPWEPLQQQQQQQQRAVHDGQQGGKVQQQHQAQAQSQSSLPAQETAATSAQTRAFEAVMLAHAKEEKRYSHICSRRGIKDLIYTTCPTCETCGSCPSNAQGPAVMVCQPGKGTQLTEIVRLGPTFTWESGKPLDIPRADAWQCPKCYAKEPGAAPLDQLELVASGPASEGASLGAGEEARAGPTAGVKEGQPFRVMLPPMEAIIPFPPTPDIVVLQSPEAILQYQQMLGVGFGTMETAIVASKLLARAALGKGPALSGLTGATSQQCQPSQEVVDCAQGSE